MSNIKLLNKDAYQLIQTIPDNSIDLILTDPPYNISRETNFKNGGGVERLRISMDFGDWDKSFDLMPYIKEFYRVLKKSGAIIIFFDLWQISYLKEALERNKFKQIRFIEWLKTNPVPINSKINYLTNAREIAVTAVKHSKPTFNSQYDNGVYRHPIYHNKDRIHPTQKPIKLFEELITKHSNEKETILDPFFGSGTTAIACINTNRIFIGSEIDKDMFNKAKKRINNHKGLI